MKIISVDDEPVMHLIMRKMLGKHPEMEVVGAFADTKAAMAFLMENKDTELAFVDISMPGDTGLTFAAKLDAAGYKTQIVFVTSHKDFALEAFELSVLDYLVKPVTQERLERTVLRALANKKAASKPEDQSIVRAASRISIAALGDFFVRNEMSRVKWISSKSAELFAYSLMNRGRWISRSRLVTDIFAGMADVNADKYLNTTVYQLRKSLEPIGLREAVRSENDGYALELDGAAIDYEEFERRAGQVESSGAQDVQEALDVEKLYTGELFGSKAYVWAIHETERLNERYSSFVSRLSKTLLELGNTTAASKLLLKLHARNPLDEKAVALLMKLRALEGDKKGLTAQYTEYVKLLNKELGIRPSQQLLLLYDSLVSGSVDGAR